MSDIFISYASADRPKVGPIVNELVQRGWTVWWDDHILAGKAWDEILGVELAQARCVVVLWSQHSVESTWVKTEAREALRRKILVPAQLDTSTIPLEFNGFQAAQLAHWPDAAAGSEFDKLIASVNEVMARSPTPVYSAKSARARADEMLESAVRRRTRWLLATLGGAVFLLATALVWHVVATRPVVSPAAAIGLVRIEPGRYNNDENERVGQAIRNARRIRLLLPNASSFAQSFQTDFEEFFSKPDATMQVLFAKPNSDFYVEMTKMTLGSKWQEKDYETNRGFVGLSRQRLFDSAHRDESKISFRYFNTQFRDPVIIFDDSYCIVTLRLPPNEGEQSPRLEFNGGYVKSCSSHFNRLWDASSNTDGSQAADGTKTPSVANQAGSSK